MPTFRSSQCRRAEAFGESVSAWPLPSLTFVVGGGRYETFKVRVEKTQNLPACKRVPSNHAPYIVATENALAGDEYSDLDCLLDFSIAALGLFYRRVWIRWLVVYLDFCVDIASIMAFDTRDSE